MIRLLPHPVNPLEFIAYEGEFFTIEWYFDSNGKSPSLEHFEELPEKEQNRLLYLFNRMGDFGKISDITKFRHEGGGIYAFKPQPERFLCFFQEGRKIIVTNGFRKKRDKLPPSEHERAMKYRQDYAARIKEGIYYEHH